MDTVAPRLSVKVNVIGLPTVNSGVGLLPGGELNVPAMMPVFVASVKPTIGAAPEPLGNCGEDHA